MTTVETDHSKRDPHAGDLWLTVERKALDRFLGQNGRSHEAVMNDFRSRLRPLFREPTENNPHLDYAGLPPPQNLEDINRLLNRVQQES